MFGRQLRARDLIFSTTDLKTVIFLQQFTARADLFLNLNLCIAAVRPRKVVV